MGFFFFSWPIYDTDTVLLFFSCVKSSGRWKNARILRESLSCFSDIFSGYARFRCYASSARKLIGFFIKVWYKIYLAWIIHESKWLLMQGTGHAAVVLHRKCSVTKQIWPDSSLCRRLKECRHNLWIIQVSKRIKNAKDMWNMRKGPCIWTFDQPFAQGFQEKVEAQSATGEDTNEIRD